MNKQELIEEINKTKEYLANMEKMYLELEEIIEPRLLDDFCGYNEEAQGFDLALAIKQIIETKEQECEELKEQLERKEESYQKLLKKSNKYIHDLVDENVADLSDLARQLQAERKKVKELEKIQLGYCQGENLFNLYQYKQAFDEIEKYLDIQQKYFDGEDYHNLLDIINKAKE